VDAESIKMGSCGKGEGKYEGKRAEEAMGTMRRREMSWEIEEILGKNPTFDAWHSTTKEKGKGASRIEKRKGIKGRDSCRPATGPPARAASSRRTPDYAARVERAREEIECGVGINAGA
jgi:hypothetical protein